jgi:hypothetical protein
MEISNATTTCDFTSTGLGATAKSMIDKTKYYIGGWNDNEYNINPVLYL